MPFSSDDLQAMRDTHVNHYGDKCKIGVQGTTQTDTGFLSESWNYGTEIDCGFKPEGGREREGANKTVLRIDASLRLPIGTEIKETDRVEITSRNGSSISEIYQVASQPKRGATGLQVDLVKVQL